MNKNEKKKIIDSIRKFKDTINLKWEPAINNIDEFDSNKNYEGIEKGFLENEYFYDCFHSNEDIRKCLALYLQIPVEKIASDFSNVEVYHINHDWPESFDEGYLADRWITKNLIDNNVSKHMLTFPFSVYVQAALGEECSYFPDKNIDEITNLDKHTRDIMKADANQVFKIH